MFCIRVLVVLIATATASGTTTDQSDWPGVAFVNGVRIVPPYHFTGAGTDTLSVNGVPLVVRSQPPASRNSDWRAQVEEDLLKELRTARGHGRDVGKSAVDRVRRVLQESPYVEWAEPSEDQVRMKLTFYDSPVIVFLGASEPTDALTALEADQLAIEGFLQNMQSGAFVAIGPKYRFMLTSSVRDAALQAAEAVQRGDAPEVPTDILIPLLDHLRDLRRKQR